MKEWEKLSQGEKSFLPAMLKTVHKYINTISGITFEGIFGALGGDTHPEQLLSLQQWLDDKTGTGKIKSWAWQSHRYDRSESQHAAAGK